MGRRLRIFFENVVVGVAIAVVFAASVFGIAYQRSYAKAEEAVDHSIEQIEILRGDGLRGIEYHLSVLEGEKESLGLDNHLSIDKLNHIVEKSEEIEQSLSENYDQEVEKKLSLLREEMDSFENHLAEAESLEISTHSDFDRAFWQYSGVDYDSVSLRKIEESLKELRVNQRVLVKNIESKKKDNLLTDLRALRSENQEIIEFLNKRTGWAAEKKVAADFQSTVNEVLESPEYLGLSYDELSDYVETEVYPLVEKSRKGKETVIAEEERLKKEAEERKRREEEERRRLLEKLKTDRYILIDLASQKLYAYQGTKLYLSTSITTGKDSTPTVRGTFRIYTKTKGRYLCGPGYCLWVDYWMPFYYGYGIHDSCNSTDCWRARFGGSDYHWNGSHGCVNTPYSAVQSLFYWAPVGTPVIVR